jgi:hypothetical protein
MRYAHVPAFPGYRAGTDGTVWTQWKRKGLGTGKGSTFVLGGNWRQLTQKPDRDGYMHVRLCRNGKKYYPAVHVVVLRTFRGPPPPGKQGRHRNGDKRKNNLGNLCWGTPTENNRDRIKHGTIPRGETHKASKLTVSSVRLILTETTKGVRPATLGRQLGVTKECVYAVLKGKTWAHLTGIKNTKRGTSACTNACCST